VLLLAHLMWEIARTAIDRRLAAAAIAHDTAATPSKPEGQGARRNDSTGSRFP
jgi:hypothetical protein